MAAAEEPGAASSAAAAAAVDAAGRDASEFSAAEPASTYFTPPSPWSWQGDLGGSHEPCELDRSAPLHDGHPRHYYHHRGDSPLPPCFVSDL